MLDINVSFTQSMLRQIIPDVRKHVTGVRLRDAWVWNAGRDHWEFHYKSFYWHGNADNAYEARYKGWSAYLRSLGIAEYK